MTGETDLGALLRSMSARLAPEVYVFVTLPGGKVPPGLSPRMVFEEAEGTTLIVAQEVAAARGLDAQFPCRMITLSVHSALEAVGFIASVAAELARHGISVNPVSGFFHDHLFVPEDRAEDAMALLAALSAQERRG